MKKLLLATMITLASSGAMASIETKDWHDTASEQGKAFAEQAIVLDFFASPAEFGWTSERMLGNYIDLAHSRGVTGASITIGTPSESTWALYLEALKKYEKGIDVATTPIVRVRNVEDFQRAHDEGAYAVMWNNQSTMMLEGDASRVKTLHEQGIRSMQLVYNGKEATGSGVIAMLNEQDSGITEFGKEVIDEMVKHGITVDFSHNSSMLINSTLDYMDSKYPDVPVIVSHSPLASTYGCENDETLKQTAERMEKLGLEKGDEDYRLAACYRLVSDEDAKRIAERGGVVSVTFTEWMMDGQWKSDITPKDAAMMVDGAVKVLGVDHVGIATDDMQTVEQVVAFATKYKDSYADNGYMLNAFDKGATGCAELSKHIAALTDELRKMGYNDDDLAKIYGKNLMRVYAQTWK